MPSSTVPPPLHPRDVADRAHAEASRALGEQPLTAVAWCSAHLVAVERVLHPAVARQVSGSKHMLREARRADLELERAVNRLDRRLTGDVHLAGTPVDALTEQVGEHLRRHTSAEQELLVALGGVLDEEAAHRLAIRLHEETGRAPTRPHAHAARAHLAAHVGYPFDAWLDRWRDLMDNRVVEGLRDAPAPRPCGPWGYYLAGVPFPGGEERNRTDS
jgi:hypothetical protein